MQGAFHDKEITNFHASQQLANGPNKDPNTPTSETSISFGAHASKLLQYII